MGRKRHQVDTYRVEELRQFTENYQDKLGEGVFGVVYKGTWKYGKLIAVKVLKERWVENQQNEFKRELKILKTITHPNIIELVGFCYQVGNKYNTTTSGVHQIGAALCFEYAPPRKP
uniref:Protein kinase domain-containing protein n=1 Tax=Triticum urartu TaxID=4572 RepID=A0A8R7QLA3_TRIUA